MSERQRQPGDRPGIPHRLDWAKLMREYLEMAKQLSSIEKCVPILESKTSYDFNAWIVDVGRAKPEEIQEFFLLDETNGWPKDGIDNRRGS